METTALLMQREVPLVFEDVRSAANEIDELGQQLNSLLRTLSNPSPPSGVVEWAGTAADLTRTTSDSIRRAVQDVGSLTSVSLSRSGRSSVCVYVPSGASGPQSQSIPSPLPHTRHAGWLCSRSCLRSTPSAGSWGWSWR